MLTTARRHFINWNGTARRGVGRSHLVTLAAIVALLFGLFPQVVGLRLPTAEAANPAPVQVYYVTLPEADALTVLSAINTAAISPITTYFSIAIGVSGTYIYYDQWENGYDSDIANPANLFSSGNPGGTQIWGNGKGSDGCAPNKNGTPITCSDANDVFTSGDVIIPNNAIPLPRNSNTLLFDARDKIGASNSIAMARASWAAGSGTLNAFAHEMYATAEWGQAYESPVGTNTAYPAQGYSGQGMFEYAALAIMASQNNTTVQIDKDANGSYESSTTLQEGGATLVTGISQGARVQSTDAAKPIQVVLVTGDIGSNYESRDMNLLPISAYGSSYWSPVGVHTGASYTPGPTRIFLYRPSTDGPTHITCDRLSPTPVKVTQAVATARSLVYVDLNTNSGAHCYASDSAGNPTTAKIFAVGTVDTAVSGTSAGQAGDWSFTLFPDGFLSTEALVGLGLGKDPTDTASNQNGSPLWVTPVCTTVVYADWNDDGTADLVDFNGDGDALDTNVDGLNETTSANGFQITQLKSVRLYEPGLDIEPFDQSGALVWSRTATGVGRGGAPGCNLALAWGQDPRTASAGVPGLDVGTSVPPLRLIEGAKSLTLDPDGDGNLDGDKDGDGVLSPGDVATYVITVKNTGGGTVSDVYVYDAAVPDKTDYNTGTTQKNVGSGWVSIPDNTSGTAFPLDATPNGVLLGTALPADTTWYVRFDVTLKNINSAGVYEEITNCDIAYTGGGTVQSCNTSLVAANEWGDLPDTYGTSLAANGPRHSPTDTNPALTLKLGDYYDRDLQGQPSTGADGDDLNQTTPPKADDEDGIVIAGSQPGWQTGSGVIGVTVANGPGCLNGWLDFTNDSGATPPAADGNFTKSGGYDTYTTYSEHIIQNLKVSSGSTQVPVTLPSGTVDPAKGLYLRFRLSPPDGSGNCTAAIAPTGFVAGGEVEDYIIKPADLLITKTDGKTTATSPGTIVYTLTVSNVGTAPATGVTLADTINSPLSYTSSTCPGTPTQAGSTYTWSLPDLNPGASTSCTVTVSVAGSLADGVVLTNYARVNTTAFEVSIANSEASDVNTVLNTLRPNLYVTKSDGATQVLAGDTIVYTINYGNSGQATATGVVVTDELPDNVTYVSATPAPTSSSGRTYAWNVADLPVGGTGSIQVTVTANTDLLPGAVILNHARISATQTDYDPSDNEATDSDTVIAPYIQVEKTATPARPGGGPVTYVIQWTNNSAATAYNISIADTLPANTTLVANSISHGGTYDTGTRTITWDLGDQPPNARGMVSFQVTVDAGAGNATQTAPTLSIEPEAGSVTVVSKTSAYTSLPYCDDAYNPKCLTYRGLYNGFSSVPPDSGWNENPRGGPAFNDNTWAQPVAAFIESVWMPASILGGEWTSVHTAGETAPNYSFFRQAFCLPLNATDLSATLSLAGDDKSRVYLNGVYAGEHTSASTYSTFSGNATAGIQSGINILAVRLLNNTHNGHPEYNGADHSGLLFNLQASFASVRPFVYVPTTTLEDQPITLTMDEAALGGRKPFQYKVSWGDGTTDAPYQEGLTFTHTYADPGVYEATVTARAQYGCTGTDRVTITVLPAGSNLLANAATVTYANKDTGGVSYSGQSGAGSLLAGAVGDRIWLDEDGDGIQDAGEAGIANVKVTLTNGSQTYTTYTDANGNYIFANIPIGSYTVSVDTSTMPAGLAANPTYDEDDVTTAHTTAVTVTAGGAHLTADFGYNWAPSADVTGNTGAGAIGDRVWIDADGDGVQDAVELGLAGVTVTIYYDPDGNGVYDTIYPNATDGNGNPLPSGTTTTDANGNYIFDGLPAGAYVVQVTLPGGYSQTGDPDQPGVTCTACDHKTTTPIILGPGDVYVNADFGYTPNPGAFGSIGDTIWLDANANGIQDDTETRIPGVSVVLIRDVNGDGVYQPGVDVILATDTTDANGNYEFPGVPTADGSGTDDYLVWVNDAHNVLAGLAPTYDSNGVATANISAVSDLTPDGDQGQDFGYTPARQKAGTGLIGDTVFLDWNGSGNYNAGEGLEGVTVFLYADSNGDGKYTAGEPLLAQTTTDQNGVYVFPYLPAGNYVVVVDATTLPAGLTNTIDPDTTDSPPHEAGVTLAAGGINLSQDFGYAGANSIAGTIWNDVNADGVLAGETGWLAGVTVALRDSNGNLVATTTTDASGNYSFANLPNGTYTVDVTDEHNVLNGFWHSLGDQAVSSDGTSKADPYTVSVTGGQTVTTADFGYYRQPADLGNYVWFDVDGDGIQDDTESGIAGAIVTLTITWPNNTTTVVKTTTDSAGKYSFGNLLLDENFDGGGTGEPTFSIAVTPPAGGGYVASPQNTTAEDKDSDDAAGQAATVTRGATDDSYDFGFYQPLTLAGTVWNDTLHRNDTQDTDEPGVANVLVHLYADANNDGIPDSTTPVGTDTTDAAGLYEFTGLAPGNYIVVIMSSNFDAGGPMAGASAVAGGADPDENTSNTDSNGIPGVTTKGGVTGIFAPTVTLVSQAEPIGDSVSGPNPPALDSNGNGTVDFGFYGGTPLGITLASMTATAAADAITVTWDTVSEINNAGFNLYRATSDAGLHPEPGEGPGVKLNADLIPSQGSGSPEGYHYVYLDSAGLTPNTTYWYWLEDVSTTGVATRHEPISVLYGGEPTALGLVAFRGVPAASATVPSVAGLAALMLAALAAATRRQTR